MERIPEIRTADAFLTGTLMARVIAAVVDGKKMAYAGRTWGDFKKAVESMGVTDNDAVSSIEYGVAQDGNGFITRDADDAGWIELREVF